MAGLSHKQRAFVESYLQCWNASEAARRAGYKGRANTVGARTLSNVVIQAEIEKRLSEMAMSSGEVLARLAEQARGEGGHYLNGEGGLDLNRLIEDGKTHLVKAIRPTQAGLVIEFYDAQSALIHIGKHLGLFTERALNIDVSELTNEQLERIANGEDPIAVLATANASAGGTVEAKPPAQVADPVP